MGAVFCRAHFISQIDVYRVVEHSKKECVIASQCAHWRGNPVNFRSILGDIPQIRWGSPHQPAGWFAMTAF